MAARDGRTRSGRDANTQAMLAAAENLFSERGFAAVSVRDIAREAGVSHALVHRYLGSKEDVYRAVLDANENSIRAAAGDTEDIRLAASLMLREGLQRHRQYLRIIVQSAVGGMPFESTIGRFPATERLIALAEEAPAERGGEAGGLEPRLTIAAMVALLLGWSAAESWLRPATGLEGVDEEAILAGLERIIVGMAAEQLPAAGR